MSTDVSLQWTYDSVRYVGAYEFVNEYIHSAKCATVIVSAGGCFDFEDCSIDVERTLYEVPRSLFFVCFWINFTHVFTHVSVNIYCV